MPEEQLKVFGAQLYEVIGGAYPATRRTELRIAAQVWDALGDARTVLNVGAGTGSYEPPDRDVTAVEPSAVMRALRPADAAPCVAADAERLPFKDQSFDAAMAFSTVHHWGDPIAGLREMRRVARRVVVFTFDGSDATYRHRFWLTRDYLPEAADIKAGWPPLPISPARSGATRSRCSSRGIAPTDSSKPTGGAPRPTWRTTCAARARCGPRSGPKLSSGRSPISAKTFRPAGGPSATGTFSLSMRPNSVSACSSHD